MRITLFAAGSRGDIQPCAILGQGLQRNGFEVRLAAPENFAGFVEEYGLPFHPLRGDIQQIMASQTGQEFMEGGSRNPLRSIRLMREMLEPVALQMAEDALAASQGAQALVSLAVFATLAKSIAEVQNIPLIHVEPTPVLPTRSFPAPGWPVQRNLGGLPNRISGQAMLRVLWLWYSSFVNRFRQDHGLRPYSAADFYRALLSTPLLGAYSDKVIPRPPDWPETVHITGYWFPPQPVGWEPDAQLARFLEAGDPPVYVGFGSMAGSQPAALAKVVLAALAESGQRGVLLTGWGGLRLVDVPESVLVIESAPHAWLFPRMAAVVHHGGAGTTAEGLRAGVPSILIPFAVDQAFWGQRVKDLGVGPEPIPVKKLTASRLAQAIRQAVRSTEMRRNAARLGEALRAEDGVGKAVELIRTCLEKKP